MNVFAKIGALMLTTYWILSFSHFCFISGERPHCFGKPLKADEFSEEEDVGYVRDLCVDLIARNIFNTLKCKPSKVCDELANTRTSTCYFKCICKKWKRSSSKNAGVTKQVMAMAEALIEHFNVVVVETLSSLYMPFTGEKFIYECIVDAEQKIIQSKAAIKGSKIIEELRKLKNNFCTRYLLDQNQRAFQESIGRNDAKAMDRMDTLVKKEDLGAAIRIFVRIFEAENMAKITQFYIITDIPTTGLFILNTIPRLKFEFKIEGYARFSTVFMKIPSLCRLMDGNLRNNVFDREIYFYTEILPRLYQLGKCEPFAPKLNAFTKENAFVLEDLTTKGYEHGNQITQFDMDQIHTALVALAKYHALGYKYLRTMSKGDPRISLIRSRRATMIKTPYTYITHSYYVSTFYKIVKPHVNELVYEKIAKAEDEIINDDFIDKFPEVNSMTVIIHGNYQMRNIFFKRDTQDKPCQAMLIDWQLGAEANPVLDLIYFFIFSIPVEIFKLNVDALLNLYISTLNDILLSTESNRTYNRIELNKDILLYKHYFLKVLSIYWQHNTQYEPPESYESISIEWMKYLENKGIF